MFGILAVLIVLDLANKPAAENVYAFFTPALEWVARWLPVFYVPPLVTLPLAVEGLAGTVLYTIHFIPLKASVLIQDMPTWLATRRQDDHWNASALLLMQSGQLC